jgi:hypothetical protein
MNPAAEICRLAKEAVIILMREDSRGMPDIEPYGVAMVELARAHPEHRAEICAAFQRVMAPDGGAWEVLLLPMHLLRWPEMREWFDTKRRDCIAASDWRGEPIYRKLVDAFDDHWENRDFYEMFKRPA